MVDYLQEVRAKVMQVCRPMVSALLAKDRGFLSDASLKAIRTEAERQTGIISATHLRMNWMSSDEDARAGKFRATVIPIRPWRP